MKREKKSAREERLHGSGPIAGFRRTLLHDGRLDVEHLCEVALAERLLFAGGVDIVLPCLLDHLSEFERDGRRRRDFVLAVQLGDLGVVRTGGSLVADGCASVRKRERRGRVAGGGRTVSPEDLSLAPLKGTRSLFLSPGCALLTGADPPPVMLLPPRVFEPMTTLQTCR